MTHEEIKTKKDKQATNKQDTEETLGDLQNLSPKEAWERVLYVRAYRTYRKQLAHWARSMAKGITRSKSQIRSKNT